MRTGMEARAVTGMVTGRPLPQLGVDAYTSPSPAVRGATQGRPAWTGSDEGTGLARLLGWFSIGLGLAQILAPRQVSKLVGVRPSRRSAMVMRFAGMREIGHGVGILSTPRPRDWVATRVAGDIMDLALLGGALAAGSEARGRTVAATLAVLGITALDIATTEELAEARKVPSPELAPDLFNTPIYSSITVEAPVEAVYAFWRDLTNLPSFMANLDSVEDLGGGRSRWRAVGPAGVVAEWDAEIVEDVANTVIAWRSVGVTELYNTGVVRFQSAPAGRGTIVTVEMRYAPPGGKIGAAFLKLLRKEPGQQVAEDLRAFKQVIETGEVLLSDATVVPGPHPARPPSPRELQH